MTKRTNRAKIEPHQGTVEMACDFSRVYGFVERAPELTLETSTGSEVAVQAAKSGSPKREIPDESRMALVTGGQRVHT
jgi:hypothetical protein